MDKATRSNLGRKAETVGFINSEKFEYKTSYSGEFYRKFYRGGAPCVFASDEQDKLIDEYERELDPPKKAAAKRGFGTINIRICVHAPCPCPHTVGI